MVRLYLDIETYRKETFKDERIIAIGVIEDWTTYKKESLEVEGELKKFSEWELNSEEEVIKKFYSYIFDIINRSDFLVIIGFGILRFDTPLLIQKGVDYGYALSDLNAFWHKTFTIDLFQSMLPAYSFRFKGNTLENLIKEAERFGDITIELYGNGGNVREWYENGEYQQIERHLEADLKAIRKLDLSGSVTKVLREKLRVDKS